MFVFEESNEDYEEYKKWYKPEMENCYFVMYARHRTCYRKGDQLLNSYGSRDNRFLLTNYGFTLRQNKYNSLGFKVFLNFNKAGEMEKFQKVIRMKKRRLST